MGITVTITLSIALDSGADDYQTTEPTTLQAVLPNSPAQVWQYQLQGSDNYLLISQTTPPSYLWLDPVPATGLLGSGATFTLRGASTDVGIPLSSVNPSLIPISSVTPLGAAYSFVTGQTTYPPQYQVDLASSVATQTRAGWF